MFHLLSVLYWVSLFVLLIYKYGLVENGSPQDLQALDVQLCLCLDINNSLMSFRVRSPTRLLEAFILGLEVFLFLL